MVPVSGSHVMVPPTPVTTSLVSVKPMDPVVRIDDCIGAETTSAVVGMSVSVASDAFDGDAIAVPMTADETSMAAPTAPDERGSPTHQLPPAS